MLSTPRETILATLSVNARGRELLFDCVIWGRSWRTGRRDGSSSGESGSYDVSAKSKSSCSKAEGHAVYLGCGRMPPDSMTLLPIMEHSPDYLN